MLVHTIFGGRESDNMVTQSELFFLWAMVNDFWINTGYYLAKHQHKVVKATKGAIIHGGLITPITLTLGVDLFDLSQPLGSI